MMLLAASCLAVRPKCRHRLRLRFGLGAQPHAKEGGAGAAAQCLLLLGRYSYPVEHEGVRRPRLPHPLA